MNPQRKDFLSVTGVIPARLDSQETAWNRTIRSNLLTTRESACSNAATMSRLIIAVAAREKRNGANEEQQQPLERLQKRQKFQSIVVRMILRNCRKFVTDLKEHLQQREDSSELARVAPRARFTVGFSYASFVALQELTPVYDAKLCSEFRLHLISKSLSAADYSQNHTKGNL